MILKNKQITIEPFNGEQARSLYKKSGFTDVGYGKNSADYRMRLGLTERT